MSASEKTKYYGLPLFAPDDVTSWEEFNKSMVEIDRLLYIAESAGGGGGGEIPPDLVDRVTALETEAASLAQEISNLGIVSSSHTDQINTLDAKAEELEADVSGLTSTTNELNVQVEDNTGDISVLVTKTNTLETEQAALGNDISDLQSDIATINTKISDLESDNTGLKNTTNNLSIQVEDNTGDIGTLVTKTNTIEQEQNALESDLNDLQSTVASFPNILVTHNIVINDRSSGVSVWLTNISNGENVNLGTWNTKKSLGFTVIQIGATNIFKGGYQFNYTGTGKTLPETFAFIRFYINLILKNEEKLPLIAEVTYYTTSPETPYIAHKVLCPACLSFSSTESSLVTVYFEKTLTEPATLRSVELYF